MISCPLCKEPETSFVLSDAIHTYYECPECRIVFADPGGFLKPADEKSRYDTHQNDPGDNGYLKFLNQLAIPVQNHLRTGAVGLDYGSGPGPAMDLLFKKGGWEMENYDPFYDKRPELLSKTYDFITCSETAEHFYHPIREFTNLWSMLRPGGILGIMTLILTETVDFESWHYRRDDTHVVFYRPESFIWLAGLFGAACEIHSDRVILLKKPG